MKVKHLILRLQACDPEAMVVVDGYEGGTSEVSNVRDSVELLLNVNSESYYGPHEEADTYHANRYPPDAPRAKAVYLRATTK